MTDLKRRTLLKASLGAAAVGVAAGAGLLTPQSVFARSWPRGAFTAKSVDGAVNDLFSGARLIKSKALTIKAPLVAEDGSSVSVEVSSSLPNTDSLSILIEQNAQPLAANFKIAENTNASVRTRVKIAKSTDVHVVARANGRLYVAKRLVKVTLGGCGG
jgi:sulfur-oxidizing protein SoxY